MDDQIRGQSKDTQKNGNVIPNLFSEAFLVKTELSDTINELRKRLEPVLSPKVATQTIESSITSEMPKEVISTVRSQIKDITSEQRRLRRIVVDILDRLEL